MSARSSGALALLLVALPLAGHERHLDADTVLRWWTLDPLVIGSFVITTILYVRGARRLSGNARLRWWEKVSFTAGWVAVLIALVSPLDRLSDILFSAHMTQHELLILVAAPLLVLGRPLVAFLHGVGPHARARVQRVLGGAPVWRALTNPLVVLLVHGAVLWVWHVPLLFEAALRNELIHAIQHLMFFVTAALFWWALMHGRYGRMGYGVSVVFVFVTAMHTGLLGVLFTFARVPWYPLYDARAAAWRVSALEDQQLAGLIMWIPSGVLFMIVALALFAAWLGESERRGALKGTLALACILLLAQCGRSDRERTAIQLTGGGDPVRGRRAIGAYGCGSCHMIPGIPGADSLVGPPLVQIARRTYLAGRLQNTPENMMRWVQHPQRQDPGTAMPEMGVTPRDARDIAAYLYTLD